MCTSRQSQEVAPGYDEKGRPLNNGQPFFAPGFMELLARGVAAPVVCSRCGSDGVRQIAGTPLRSCTHCGADLY